jgi:hypothetical protein
MAHSHEHSSASPVTGRSAADALQRSGVSRLVVVGLVSAVLWAVLLWAMNAG